MAKEKDAKEEAKKSKLKKPIVLGGIGAGVLIVIAAVAVIVLGGGDEDDVAAELTTAEEIAADAMGNAASSSGHGAEIAQGRGGGTASAPDSGAGEVTTSYAFEQPFVVNLYEEGGRRFLNLELEIEAVKPETVQRARRNVAPLRDSIIMLLSSKTMAEISNVEGKFRLKQEILMRIEAILDPGSIKSVYFTDFSILYN